MPAAFTQSAIRPVTDTHLQRHRARQAKIHIAAEPALAALYGQVLFSGANAGQLCRGHTLPPGLGAGRNSRRPQNALRSFRMSRPPFGNPS